MSIENPQNNNEGKEIEEIAGLLREKFPELDSFALKSVSMPVPGIGLRIVEMEGESDTKYFKVDVDTNEATEWKPAERQG